MRSRIPALAAILVMAPTLASAGHPNDWFAYTGADEPSTIWDTADRMFETPNQEPVEKVYFNGFIVHNGFWGLDFQPEGGTIISPVAVTFEAALGFWRDCNRDGYIGARVVPASFGSWSVYPRAASLTPIDETVCPPGSPYNPTNALTNSPNGQIDEMRWIGPFANTPYPPPPAQTCVPPSGNPVRICAPVTVDTRITADKYDVTDAGARVWFDWGHPGQRHLPDQRTAVQYYQTRDSDGTLEYVDGAVQFTFSRTLGPAWTTKPNVGRCDEPPTFLGGPGSRLPVADRGTCGLYPLHQAYRLVNDSRTWDAQAKPLVTVFDTQTNSGGGASPCDDGFDQTIAGRRIAFANVQPALHPNFLVEGSLVGTYDNVNAGTANGQFTGQCTRNNLGLGGVGEEDGAEPTHRKVTDELAFTADQRYHLLDAFGFEQMSPDVLGLRGTPQGHNSAPTWSNFRLIAMRPPRTGFGLLDESFGTFYADVTCGSVRPTPTDSCATNNPAAAAATALPARKQNAFTYGTEYCPAITTGTTNVNPANDWECSVTVWIAKNQADNQPNRPVLGDPYDLRDVDCADNRLIDSAYTAGVNVVVGLGDCAPFAH